MLEGNLINFEKVKMVAKRLHELDVCLRNSYNFQTLPSVQESLVSAEAWNENDIFRVSKLHEPRTEGEHALPSRLDSKEFERITKSILAGKGKVSTTDNKLSKRDWQLLLATANVVTLQKNTVIIQEGTLNTHLYRIKSGRVRVEKAMVSTFDTIILPHVFVCALFLRLCLYVLCLCVRVILLCLLFPVCLYVWSVLLRACVVCIVKCELALRVFVFVSFCFLTPVQKNAETGEVKLTQVSTMTEPETFGEMSMLGSFGRER